ncbi:guanine deaminase [Usitatibacter palustris]|uniref:Guanine deaminase n=1 Tax=Usitatibacter palustris TaxID=2732487 RepID=A0A6M4H6N6_9PROT|nr:guanine deaminase [Usitatibacter palustris]QJR15276.1 Guanine deaminase [Usitatibacter palustris]
MAAELTAFRGTILYFRDDPGVASPADSHVHIEDGLLVIENGHVARVGPAEPLLAALPKGTPVTDHRGMLLMPGFIDAHVHYAQTDVIASGGGTLLNWLEQHIFPEEARFAEHAHASEVADFFLDELLRHGTTTALVFGSVHRTSADAFFEAAARRGMRLGAGQVMMDRHCPEALRDTAESSHRDARELIERWDGNGRLHYAITPRFAVTSSDEQLRLAGELARAHPNAFIHSHVAENTDEVAWVAKLFPGARSYLDVYERFGLLRERAIYAHCIHLDAADRRRMAETGAAAAFCPTSNLFLGSGLFDIEATDAAGMRFALATDVGGGTSFSLLQTMQDAYKVAQQKGQTLTALRAFYLATLGGARALRLDDRIGSFEPGREADFIVLDPAATPLMERRMRSARTLEERLFAWMILGDERSVRQAYVMGKLASTSASAAARSA